MLRHVNVNGRLLKHTNAAVPYDSRAVRFGFSLFETMLIQDGQIQLEEYHWERLFKGLKKFDFVLPELMDKEWMKEEIMRTVKKNNISKLCRVRFQIYAGRGGLFDGQNPWSEFVIYCETVEQHVLQLNEKGLTLTYATGLAKSADSIANYKTTNAMIYALGARQAKARKTDDAIIVNTDDNPIETTIANIFCIYDDVIYTPSLAEGCVAGVMRRHVLKELSEKGFKVKEKAITREFLIDAEAVFATNAIRRLKWVENIDGHRYSIDKILNVYEQIAY